MNLHKFHITVGAPNPRLSKVTIDGQELRGVRRVSFDLTAKGSPVLRLEIMGEVVVDGEFRDRVMYVADNCRVMRAIDLSPFNCFDHDSWGSPWQTVAVMCARRPVAPGERIGIVLTEGSGLKIKMGTIPFSLAYMARVDPKIRGASGRDGQAKIIARAINEMARRMNCRIVRRWEAHGKAASNMVYVGMVLEGVGKIG